MRRVWLPLLLVSCSSVHPLQDANVYKRREAAILLAEETELAARNLPFLLRAMKDVDAEVRWRAEFALGRIGPDVLPELTEALQGPDAWAAAYVLGPVGKRANGALALAAASSDPDVRLLGRHALADLERPPAPAAALPGEAKFGLLFQWGLYSVPHRSRPGEPAERIMRSEKLSAADYELYGASFTASHFDAREWVRIAKEAGARTVVLTAKDRDGFCLWDSTLTDFNSVRASEARRDLVKELSTACRRADLTFGVTYSMIDWHRPETGTEPAHRQLEELLGRTPIAGVWLDGSKELPTEEADAFRATVRRAQPDALVGDSDSCRTFGASRGYSESPEPLKSAERIIDELVDAVSSGHGYLLAVGARPDGAIPDPFLERLTVIGEWMQWNGEAIHGTGKSPLAPIAAGRVTAKGNRLYVFLNPGSKDDRIDFPGLKDRILRAWVLGTNDPLEIRSDAGGPWIPAPARLQEAITVVAVELDMIK